ncbi:MAG: hypothetical protein ACOCXP_00355 [Candidatus Dojkabacteria bacterium]
MFQDISKVEQNLAELLESFPNIAQILQKLNQNQIKYGIYSGSFVAIASGYRKTRDIDIIVADRDSLRLRLLFPEIKIKSFPYCRFSYLGEKDEVEIISHSDINVTEHTYSFRLTNLAWRNTHKIFTPQVSLNVLNPVDTLLIKSFLRRGEEKGKYDLSDISQLLQSTEIDHRYLIRRLQEINPDERVLNFLKQNKLLFKQY